MDDLSKRDLIYLTFLLVQLTAEHVKWNQELLKVAEEIRQRRAA